MKTPAYFLLAIILLAIPATSLAYAGESSLEPIYVKVEPTQATKNLNTEARLKSQYGTSAFYDCYKPCLTKDTSNPYDQTTCLLQTEYCLQSKQNFNVNKLGSGDVPSSVVQQAVNLLGNGTANTVKTPDTICHDHYGVNSYYTGNKGADGSYICDCQGGYMWKNQYCVSKTTEPPQVVPALQEVIVTKTLNQPIMEAVEINDSLPTPLPEPYKEPKVYKAPVTIEEPKIEVSEPVVESPEETNLAPSTTAPQPIVTKFQLPEAPHIQATTTSEKPKSVISRVFSRVTGWFAKLFK